jgi:DNA mismatch repair protein MutS
VSEIREGNLLRESLRAILKDVYDLERLGSRIAVGLANGRDLAALRTSLLVLPRLRDAISGCEAPFLRAIRDGIDEMPDLKGLIERAIVDDPPLTIREGGIIREGYDPKGSGPAFTR